MLTHRRGKRSSAYLSRNRSSRYWRKALTRGADVQDLRELHRAPTRGEAVRVVSLPDGRLIVSNEADRSLSLLRPDTLAEERRLPLGAAAPGLNLDAGRQRLYASLDDNRVAVVNLADWKIDGYFSTLAAPDSAVVHAGAQS